jgi:hypothetical protein
MASQQKNHGFSTILASSDTCPLKSSPPLFVARHLTIGIYAISRQTLVSFSAYSFLGLAGAKLEIVTAPIESTAQRGLLTTKRCIMMDTTP